MDRFSHTNEADDDDESTEEPSFQLSQTDQYIKVLNNQGLSAGQIAKSLKSYGIDLSKASVLRHITESTDIMIMLNVLTNLQVLNY